MFTSIYSLSNRAVLSFFRSRNWFNLAFPYKNEDCRRELLVSSKMMLDYCPTTLKGPYETIVFVYKEAYRLDSAQSIRFLMSTFLNSCPFSTNEYSHSYIDKVVEQVKFAEDSYQEPNTDVLTEVLLHDGHNTETSDLYSPQADFSSKRKLSDNLVNDSVKNVKKDTEPSVPSQETSQMETDVAVSTKEPDLYSLPPEPLVQFTSIETFSSNLESLPEMEVHNDDNPEDQASVQEAKQVDATQMTSEAQEILQFFVED